MQSIVSSDLSVYNVDTMSEKEVRIRGSVGKWGNSAAVRLPATLLEQANLSPQQPIDLLLSSGRIILEPVRDQEFELSALLSLITPENLHGEIDLGGPVGREAF